MVSELPSRTCFTDFVNRHFSIRTPACADFVLGIWCCRIATSIQCASFATLACRIAGAVVPLLVGRGPSWTHINTLLINMVCQLAYWAVDTVVVHAGGLPDSALLDTLVGCLIGIYPPKLHRAFATDLCRVVRSSSSATSGNTLGWHPFIIWGALISAPARGTWICTSSTRRACISSRRRHIHAMRRAWSGRNCRAACNATAW